MVDRFDSLPETTTSKFTTSENSHSLESMNFIFWWPLLPIFFQVRYPWVARSLPFLPNGNVPMPCDSAFFALHLSWRNFVGPSSGPRTMLTWYLVVGSHAAEFHSSPFEKVPKPKKRKLKKSWKHGFSGASLNFGCVCRLILGNDWVLLVWVVFCVLDGRQNFLHQILLLPPSSTLESIISWVTR